MKAFAFVLAVIALTSASSFAANEYWITPFGVNGTGSGAIGDPYVDTDEPTFDTNIAVIPSESTIHLMPGYFTTTNIIPKKDWKIRGAGIDVTTLRMSSAPPSGASTYPWPVIGNYANDPEPGVEVSDMTIDCHQLDGTCIEAVSLQGSETRISRVKAINWGTDNGAECFIFNIVNQSSEAYTNCVIDGCIIGAGAGGAQNNGSDGMVIYGGGSLSRIVGAEIRNCVVSSVTPSGSLYFNAYGMSEMLGGKIDGNEALNLGGDSQGVYESCGSMSNLVIENNLFLNVTHGVIFAGSDGCNAGSGLDKWNILIRNNIITILNGGIGMSLNGFEGQKSTNVVVTGNFIQAAGTGSSTAGIQFFTNDIIFCNNNIIDLKGNGEQFYYDDSDTCASIGNNTDIQGNPIGSQETWPTLHRWSAELPIEYAGNLNGLASGNAPNPIVYDAAYSSGTGAATAWNTVPHGLGFSNIVSEIDVEGNTGISPTTVEVQLATFTGNLTLVSAVSFTNTVSADGITTFTLTNAPGWRTDSGPRQVRALLMNPSTQAAPANEVWLVGWRTRSVE